jgi:hypothetical protein
MPARRSVPARERHSQARLEKLKRACGMQAKQASFCIAVLAFIAPLEACLSYPAIPVTGRLANTPISTTVDSALAKDYLTGSSSHSAKGGNDAERTAEISEATSPDFATIYFIDRCLSDHTIQRFQTGYSRELQRVESLIRQREWARAGPGRPISR